MRGIINTIRGEGSRQEQRMTELRMVFIGTDTGAMNRVRDTAEAVFEKEGFEVVWRAPYPNVAYRDVQAALADEDLERKNAEWVRSIDEETIEAVLSHTDEARPTVRGWGLLAEPGDTLEWYDIADEVLERADVTGMVEHQLTVAVPHDESVGTPQPTKNKNAPFSYDPAQDFKTEPGK